VERHEQRPTIMPMMMARTGQNSDAPALMLIRPAASVAICAFSMNHNGPRCQTLPCRSFSGTNSGERPSWPPHLTVRADHAIQARWSRQNW
jgi:hypothetical protein